MQKICCKLKSSIFIQSTPQVYFGCMPTEVSNRVGRETWKLTITMHCGYTFDGSVPTAQREHRKKGNYLENLEYLPRGGGTLEPTLEYRSWPVDKKIEVAQDILRKKTGELRVYDREGQC